MANVNPVDVQKFLSGINFPASKQDIIDHVRKNGGNGDVVSKLEALEDKTYNNTAEVTAEMGDMGDEEEDTETEAVS